MHVLGLMDEEPEGRWVYSSLGALVVEDHVDKDLCASRSHSHAGYSVGHLVVSFNTHSCWLLVNEKRK